MREPGSSPSREIAEFAWPLSVRNLASAVNKIVGALLIAEIDSNLLPAFALTQIMDAFLLSFTHGATLSIIPLVNLPNEEDEDETDCQEKVGVTFRQAMVFACLLGGVSVSIALSANQLFLLSKQPAVVTDHAHDYFQFACIGLFAETLFRAQARCTVGLGDRYSVAVGDACNAAINLLLIHIFMSGRWGCHKMGLRGAGIAMAVSKSATVLLHTAYMALKPDFQRYAMFRVNRHFIDRGTLVNMLKNGVPRGIDMCLGLASYMLVALFCGLHGTKGLVALQVANLYRTFVALVFNAISQAGMKITSECVKRGREYDVAAYARPTVFLNLGFSLFALPFAFALPGYIAALLVDRDDHAHFDTAVAFLKIQSVLEVLTGMRYALYGILTGLREAFVPMLITLLGELGVNASAAAIVIFALHRSEADIYGSQLIGFFVTTGALLVYLMHCLKARGNPDAEPLISETRQASVQTSQKFFNITTRPYGDFSYVYTNLESPA